MERIACKIDGRGLGMQYKFASLTSSPNMATLFQIQCRFQLGGPVSGDPNPIHLHLDPPWMGIAANSISSCKYTFWINALWATLYAVRLCGLVQALSHSLSSMI